MPMPLFTDSSLAAFLELDGSPGTLQPSPESSLEAAELPSVLCPFLRIVQPDTSSLSAFTQDIIDAGVSPFLATAQSSILTAFQEGKGFRAVLRDEAIDVERLDELQAGINSPDYYQLFPEAVAQRLTDVSMDGMVTLQDLVDVKLWVAGEVGVVPNDTSKISTYFSFLFPGGDLDTGLVELDDVLKFLNGEMPDHTGFLDVVKLGRAAALAPF